MVVNFEFLGGEPIENLITCMHFKIDKVVFFGYHKIVEEQRNSTESFLKKYCGVKMVVFHELSQKDLQSTLKTMRNEVQHDRSQNNKVYFDITGGESLILVAFGMLSREFETPMHMYDIASNELVELDEGANPSISKDVEKQEIQMTIGRLVRMHGGRVNTRLQKEFRSLNDPEYIEDIKNIYSVAQDNWDYWNHFSAFLRVNMAPDDSLKANRSAYFVSDSLHSANQSQKLTIRKLNEILDALSEKGILLDAIHTNGIFCFTYKNEKVKDCLFDGGSILELYTALKEFDDSDECQVGVHIDWDGIIHDQRGIDVLNEIDVLSLKGNIPTFISCKSGKMEATQSLHALYELETVAKRFGGKYSKKILVTAQPLQSVYVERAKEMGIDMRQVSLNG